MTRVQIAKHADTHKSGGSDPIPGIDQFVKFNDPNDLLTSRYLLIPINAGDPTLGYGLHISESGSSQGIKVETDNRNIELNSGSGLVLDASTVVGINALNTQIFMSGANGDGIALQVNPSSGNLGVSMNDHNGDPMVLVQDFVTSTKLTINTTEVSSINDTFEVDTEGNQTITLDSTPYPVGQYLLEQAAAGDGGTLLRSLNNFIWLYGDGDGGIALITAVGGNGSVTIDSDNAVNIISETAQTINLVCGGTQLSVVGGSDVVVNLETGGSFQVLNSSLDPIFQVDEDGDLHGLTGKALTFDL